MSDASSEWADLRSEAEALSGQMIDLRRTIHRRPELGLHNPLTQQLILGALDGLVDDVRTGSALTSVCADIVGRGDGPTVLLRADTDALPMTEENHDEFRSELDGCAHLCGHDAHIAMLVGAARLLSQRRDSFAGTVRLVFQPGEEGSGGAEVMIGEGVLDGAAGRAPVGRAFAIHVTPNAPSGLVVSRPGALLAATDDFRIVVRGRGGHASTPHFANDPVPVACEMVAALQTFVGRRVNVFDPAVVTVGRISAGSTFNVIPESAELIGTIRTVSDATRRLVVEGVERVVRGVASAHDCGVEVQLDAGYPVTSNHASVMGSLERVVREVAGPHAYFESPAPVMGAEDFSYFLERVPGAMVFLGACPPEVEDPFAAPSCHSNHMRIDESALPLGATLHAAVALRWLSEVAAQHA